MPASTPRGAPYPVATDNNDVPGDMQRLAEWVDLRPGISTLTTVQRDALAGADLWTGRVIFNTTTAELQRYNGAAWEALPYLLKSGGTVTGSLTSENGTAYTEVAAARTGTDGVRSKAVVTNGASGNTASDYAYAIIGSLRPGGWSGRFDFLPSGLVRFLATDPAAVPQLGLSDGAAATPTLTFINNPNTGLYRALADEISVAIAGARAFSFGAGRFTPILNDTVDLGLPANRWNDAHMVRARLGDGTAAAPSLTFGAELTTGLYRVGTYTVGMAAEGALVARWQFSFGERRFLPGADNSAILGMSGLRWKEVWAVNGTIQTSDVNEKTDVTPITGSAALDRVLRTAANAIQFKWINGKRTHAGFSAQGVGQEHGTDTAAYIDPAVEANARTNPYAAAEPTAEWYADYVEPDEDAETQAEQRAEAEAEWVKARDEFDAETQAMRAAPKGIRPAELIPDLYAAIAEQQKQIEALTARVEALEGASA